MRKSQLRSWSKLHSSKASLNRVSCDYFSFSGSNIASVIIIHIMSDEQVAKSFNAFNGHWQVTCKSYMVDRETHHLVKVLYVVFNRFKSHFEHFCFKNKVYITRNYKNLGKHNNI